MDDKKKTGGWLVIERSPRESITINSNIEISVSKIKGNSAWIAIRAPRDVDVSRSERKFLPPKAKK